MSIEQALAENTSAIRELIAAIRAGVPTTAAQVAAQAVEALAGHANKPTPTATYEDAKAAVLKISKEKGRDAAVAVLSTFGVQKLPDLQPENYGALVAKVDEALA